MKYVLLALLTIAFVFFIVRTFKNEQTAIYTVTCGTWDCLVANKNKDAIVEGLLQKYTPTKAGKGANYMFWDWEIVLKDGGAVPLKKVSNGADYGHFENKNVKIKGKIFYGIVIGSKNEKAQNASGFRIDPEEVEEVNVIYKQD
jgi:hypothetical protein